MENYRKALSEFVQKLAQKSPAKAEDVWESSSAIHVGHFLSKMTAKDDQETFLLTFERIAEREKLPKTQWAGLVTLLLIGELQRACYNLESMGTQDKKSGRKFWHS